MSYTNGLDKPSDYFTTKLYSGNSSTQSITGLDFQPDWVWCKVRSQADNHAIFDAVRGGQKQLRSNTNGAELTRTNAISSFNSDGWSMGSQPEMNTNGQTYASWNWKAGTSFTNDASGTGIGTIDSTGSASDASGFSIVSYTGTGSNGTIKHGLNTAPKMILIKQRSGTRVWLVGHNSLGWNKYLILNSTDAQGTSSGYFQSTAPTTSVFSVGTGNETNESSGTFIAYCFAEKQGYSKFGSYTGNGSTDGTFIYLGFKPAFFLAKQTTDKNWYMKDNKRLASFNPANGHIYPNQSNAEEDYADFDFLSNGVKIRHNGTDVNESGGSYIYACFASNPLVTSTGVPATAR